MTAHPPLNVTASIRALRLCAVVRAQTDIDFQCDRRKDAHSVGVAEESDRPEELLVQSGRSPSSAAPRDQALAGGSR